MDEHRARPSRRLIGTGFLILGIALAVMAARSRFVIVTVTGESMAPTFRRGDRVIVRRVRPSVLRPGQVVVFQRQGPGGHWGTAPLSTRAAARQPWYIKRIAAVAADPVPDLVAATVGESFVPEGKLVVLGDSDQSSDSRSWGFVPADRVLGIVVRRLRPRQ
ncbi:S26 family signal peptidase [Nonomuraea jiangxiensis]|uniref:S26 family signal peptidase n=1 Tax=Nonomuraea jiangxiensis TaxID=633440 RepID=UPI001C409FC5|nr:S26 family signal peptidase [Nonomuraea jiangxiensis]